MKKTVLQSIIFLIIFSVFSANIKAKEVQTFGNITTKSVAKKTNKPSNLTFKTSIEATIQVIGNQVPVYFQSIPQISFLHYIYTVKKTKQIFFKNTLLDILFNRFAPANAP
ncbi:MAG: hypothetical protein EAZ27_00320 [Cytophagales bacterium]|nr:MAG: hypothetical protein EAZ27_00320 [Cytophagales bacterium]